MTEVEMRAEMAADQNAGWKISIVGAAMAKAAGKNLDNDNLWMYAAYRAVETDLKLGTNVEEKCPACGSADCKIYVLYKCKNHDVCGLECSQFFGTAQSHEVADPVSLSHELRGVLTDIESGKPFDDTCKETVQRVIEALGSPRSFLL